MPITFHNYPAIPQLEEPYARVRAFLLSLGATNYSYGRWDWMATHPMLDTSALGKIGLWEEGGDLVALATYDTTLGQGFPLVRPGYDNLREEVFDYAQAHFAREDRYTVMLPDGDAAWQSIAAAKGYVATQDHESDAVYIRQETPYLLPEGFSITSLADTFDLHQYDQVLYKGFNHETKDGPYNPANAEIEASRAAMLRPNVDLSLKIAVVAPNGDFVAYCGMWCDPAVDFAIVEPVATDPAYRKMGLGRAAVLEGIRRCQAKGASRAFVGSSQQFYYNIGFMPYATTTGWRRRDLLDA